MGKIIHIWFVLRVYFSNLLLWVYNYYYKNTTLRHKSSHVVNHVKEISNV